MASRTETGRQEVRRRILAWYARKGRTLPWRGIDDPYRILVAEVMSHQTRLDRVEKLYPLFLSRFPTFRSLAGAKQSDVVVAWRGLGYNGRAVRLYRLARIVVDQHGGRFPSTLAEILALPGIGPYTAHTMMAAVYGMDTPVIDVNVRRVLSRIFWRTRDFSLYRSEREIWSLSERIIPIGRGYDWAQALMDLGALICTARTPRCAICPVGPECASRSHLREGARRPSPSERSMRGIPDRIYRGRIIEALRSARRGMPIRILGSRVLPGFSPAQAGWLGRLVDGLERDLLIRSTGPSTNPDSRVRLA